MGKANISEEEMIVERLDRELVMHGRLFDYYHDKVKIPNGNIDQYDFIKHKGAGAVVPVTEDGKLLMVKQYRNAIDRITIEVPAGGRLDENEPTIETARRELEEETGYKSDDIELLLSLCTTVAFCNEKIDIYVARNLVKTETHLDEDEFINAVPYDVDTLVNYIYEGKIQDAKTIAAILAYKDKFVK